MALKSSAHSIVIAISSSLSHLLVIVVVSSSEGGVEVVRCGAECVAVRINTLRTGDPLVREGHGAVSAVVECVLDAYRSRKRKK